MRARSLDGMLLRILRIATNIHTKYICFDSIYTKLVVFNLHLYNVSFMSMMMMMLLPLSREVFAVLRSLQALVTESRLDLFLLMLVLPLPLLGELEPETVLKDLADRLQRHALDIRVEEDDEQPAEEADTAVETKGSGRCDALHHGEESAADDDVGAPATADCVSGGAIDVSSIVRH